MPNTKTIILYLRAYAVFFTIFSFCKTKNPAEGGRVFSVDPAGIVPKILASFRALDFRGSSKLQIARRLASSFGKPAFPKIEKALFQEPFLSHTSFARSLANIPLFSFIILLLKTMST